jgi:hypothetical protein
MTAEAGSVPSVVVTDSMPEVSPIMTAGYVESRSNVIYGVRV